MKNSTLIYGLRPVMEAILAGKEIDKVFIHSGQRGSELFRELGELIRTHQILAQYVPIEKISKLAPNNNQGVVAYLSPISYQKLEDLIPHIYEQGRDPMILVLDRITDVRNFGAIVRTAECVGIDAVVIPSRGAAQINEDAIKTSAGAIHTVPICREDNLKSCIHFLKASGLSIVAAGEKSHKDLYQSALTGPIALIMGSEEDGVSPEYLKLCDQSVRIPLLGEIGSLNVSVACGIILYEILRQRQ